MTKAAEDLILQLLSEGQTKVLIANSIGVDWEDIDRWENGYGEPTEQQMRRMLSLVRQDDAS